MTNDERARWIALIRPMSMRERVEILANEKAGFPPMCDPVLWREFWSR